MKLSLLACLSILIFCRMSFGQDNSPKEFALYLLPDNIKSTQLSRLDVKTLKPEGKPFIASENIQYYQKETHEFQVDYVAAERLKNLRIPVDGKPFVVFVGDEAIYAGAFWTTLSSLSFKGININKTKNIEKASNPDFPILSLDLGYPETSFFKGADLRSDARILQALEKAGLLYEELEMLVTCKKITGTGKRHPSYIFTFDIESVEKGKFEKPEIIFELYNDFGGAEMRKVLESVNNPFDIGTDRKFNREKKLLLKFLQQIAPVNPQIFFQDFEIK